MPNKKPSPPKPRIANDNHDDIGQQGHTKVGGNKIHGDDLEAVIPSTPMTVGDINDKQPKQ